MTALPRDERGRVKTLKTGRIPVFDLTAKKWRNVWPVDAREQLKRGLGALEEPAAEQEAPEKAKPETAPPPEPAPQAVSVGSESTASSLSISPPPTVEERKAARERRRAERESKQG